MRFNIAALLVLTFAQPASAVSVADVDPSPIRVAQNTPGADAAPSSDTQAPATMGGAPGADAAPASSTPSSGTMTGSPGKDGAPVSSDTGGSTPASPHSR